MVQACGICGYGEPRARHVTRSFGKGDGLVVIENIPYVFCPNCGERYFTVETLREVERIKRKREASFTRKPVRVVSFRAS